MKQQKMYTQDQVDDYLDNEDAKREYKDVKKSNAINEVLYVGLLFITIFLGVKITNILPNGSLLVKMWTFIVVTLIVLGLGVWNIMGTVHKMQQEKLNEEIIQ